MFDYRIPPGSMVFTPAIETMFKLVYKYDNIRVTPSMEVGWVDRPLQELSRTVMEKGTLDCRIFDKYHFDYVVEKHLHTSPDCLKIEAYQGEYRIWKVLSKPSQK